jgi:hypothetical protein
MHEVSGGIGQPERHNQIFTNVISGRESHLQDIFFMNFDLMITRPMINLGKHFSTHKLIEQEVDAGQWVLVLDYHRIEWSIIDTQTQRMILLLHKESRTTPRR